MKTITICCQKGGVGKSTTAIHLSAAYAQTANIGIVELDTQSSLKVWLRQRGDDDYPLISIPTNAIPKAVAAAKKEGFDYLFIDTAPTANVADLRPAFEASDLIIIVVIPELWDLDAAMKSTKLAKSLGKKLIVVLSKVDPQRGFAKHWSVVEANRELGNLVAIAPYEITQRASIKAANRMGKTIFEYEPGGKAANEYSQLAHWIYEEVFK